MKSVDFHVNSERLLQARIIKVCTGQNISALYFALMEILIYYGVLFLAKVFDNALRTTKTILIQRSRRLHAGRGWKSETYLSLS